MPWQSNVVQRGNQTPARNLHSFILIKFPFALRIHASVASLLLSFLGNTSSLEAQAPVTNQPVFVGSEMEQYLRFAATMMPGSGDPWSIRSFTREQQATLARVSGEHPWKNRLAGNSSTNTFSFQLLPLQAQLIFNSAFPFGNNDGAVWAGKGVTSVLRAGFAARWSDVSLTIAPLISRAENSSFPLMFNQATGRLQFGDGQFSDFVDRPQRFGTNPYQVIDPGQSSLQFDGAGVSLGISSANQSWGPSERYQFILGNNAAGFPHIFVGTEEPVNIGIGKLHTRLIWGILEQSAFSPVSGPQYFVDATNSGRKRFASGMISVLQPRGIPGMELGIGRFFHSPWPQGGLATSDFTGLFQNVFKKNLPKEAPLPGNANTQGVRDNQLFSLFTRWAVPGTGLEVYGEFGRDDHSYDARDLFQEPDHGGASRMLGLRKMWMNGLALRAEAINYESPQLTKVRPEGSVYLHNVLRQGHTEKGQPLGADVGMGTGAGSIVSVDKYTPEGRTTFSWSREIAHQNRVYVPSGPAVKKAPDVLHTLRAEAFRFRGPVDLTGKLNLTMDFNRYFQSDVFNLNLAIGTSYRF